MPRISVIVPVHNASAWLGDCLDALLGQDIPPDDFEVIAVDNLSSDDSMAVARRRQRVRLLSEKRPGAYVARNQGIRAVSGELVAFIDADCVPRPDWLRHLHSTMAEASGTVVVVGRNIPSGPSLAIRLLGLYDHAKQEYVFSSADPSLYYGQSGCMLVRLDAFGELGHFDRRPRGADVIFVQRVLQRYGTRAVRYQPSAVVDHLEARRQCISGKPSSMAEAPETIVALCRHGRCEAANGSRFSARSCAAMRSRRCTLRTCFCS